MKPYQYFWRLARFRPLYLSADVLTITIHMAFMTLFGLILRAYFNYLTDEPTFSLSLWPVIGLHIIYTIVNTSTHMASIIAFNSFKYHSMALMMRNLVARILQQPGGQPLPRKENGDYMAVGEAISTLRDDTDLVTEAIVLFDDIVGLGTNALLSLIVMLSINVPITLGTFVPLAAVVGIAHWLGERIKKYRTESRKATSRVTGLIADIFNATQTIKVRNAEDRLMAHFTKINDARRSAMVRDRFLTQLVDALGASTIQLGVGLVLLLAAREMQAGTFTLGDFALFVAYLWPVTELMRITANVMTGYKQTYVSIARMESMMQGAPEGSPVAHHEIYLRSPVPKLPPLTKQPSDRLETLTVSNLSFQYEGSDQGINDISFELRRGQVKVITGRVGSGKSTILDVLLGLTPATQGTISWNGKSIDELREFMVPPRVAYTGQVPRLFSESIRDNLLLGQEQSSEAIARAIDHAVLADDIAQMEEGLNTLVGPRGLRLSGGQVQRTAAARMFLHNAELLIFDDLSSALDVETERTLWRRFFALPEAERPACLVVSHRRMVLQQADELLVVANGRLVERGTYAALKEKNPDMDRLWATPAAEATE